MVPQPGGAVLVLNGAHRGARGTLQAIDTTRFQADVGEPACLGSCRLLQLLPE